MPDLVFMRALVAALVESFSPVMVRYGFPRMPLIASVEIGKDNVVHEIALPAGTMPSQPGGNAGWLPFGLPKVVLQ